MPLKENYERVSIRNNNESNQQFIYELKNYLDEMFEKNRIQYFYLELDGKESKNIDELENFEIINYFIAYHPISDDFGYLFYKQFCHLLTPYQFQLFGFCDNGDDRWYYAYDGKMITDLKYRANDLKFSNFDFYNTKCFMMMFDLPEEEIIDDFHLLLKEWTSYGNEFFEECANIELFDGNVSYYLEESFHLSEKEFLEVLFIYERLIIKAARLNGQLVNVRCCWYMHSKEKDAILKINKDHYEIYETKPFFQFYLN